MKARRKMPPARPSRPIDTLEPPGWGPWKVFLLVNVGEGEDSKKQTEIRLGNMPRVCCTDPSAFLQKSLVLKTQTLAWSKRSKTLWIKATGPL